MKFTLFVIALLLPAVGRAQVPVGVSTPGAAQACVTYHGKYGEGSPTVGAPRIAGQPRHYLLKQLESYVDGRRGSAVMEPIAKGLPPDIRAELATYYSQVDAPVPTRTKARPSKRGQELATVGNPQRRVQACDNCHGPGGTGEPPAQPYLAGLDANYLSASINTWKDGTRRNDAGQQMATIARAMTREDIDAVAQHYASLTPPKPWPPHIVQPPLPRQPAPPPAASTPSARGGAAPTVGVEQGAPTVGGTQGPNADMSSKGGSGASTSGDRVGASRQDASSPLEPVTNAAQGRAILASGAYGCAGCHTIPGIRSASGIVGPSLAGIAQRAFIAGQLPNRPDVMVSFLQDPPALIPRTGMPNVRLSPDEARHITAYLYTLQSADAR